jgi:uncharacterized protein YdhG (YjbR/CyaY superfamily)
MPAVDDYLASLDPASRATFAEVVAIALELAPNAEQGMSYGMAALRRMEEIQGPGA